MITGASNEIRLHGNVKKNIEYTEKGDGKLAKPGKKFAKHKSYLRKTKALEHCS